jgi:hypothetical protein
LTVTSYRVWRLENKGVALKDVGINRYLAVTWLSLATEVDDGNLLVSREKAPSGYM